MAVKTIITNINALTGFLNLTDCCISIDENGKIEDIFNHSRLKQRNYPSNVQIINGNGCSATPGLIDTHIHGIGGYGTEDMSSDSILGMSEHLAEFGITSFIPTVFPFKEENLFKEIDAIVNAMGHEKGARILGINVEGPFLCPEKSGALPTDGLSPVDLKYFNRIVDRGQGKIICMTVAPELKGMRELALEARKKGIVLLVGHTNAEYSNIIDGMQCGILHSTHFFNAMKRLHHRDPGTVGAILFQNEMCCEIICDGIHVHPEIVQLLLREKSVNNIVLVTDALKPAGLTHGPFFVSGHEVIIKNGAFFVKDSPDTLNGSALTLNKAVFNMVTWGESSSNAIKMATENPARIYHLDKIGTLMPGNVADITLFDSSFNPTAVFVNGIQIFNKQGSSLIR